MNPALVLVDIQRDYFAGGRMEVVGAVEGLDVPAKHVHGAYMAALGAVFAKVSSSEEIIGMI